MTLAEHLWLVTPTFRQDYERFALLRESMERVGILLPHLAVVHEEDLALFEKIPHGTNLEVVSTAAILPLWAERSRRASRNSAGYLPWYRPGRRRMTGWMAQQLVKLSADRILGAGHWVTLDSDVVFLRCLDVSDFVDESGDPILLEIRGLLGAEPREFNRRSAQFLGLAGAPGTDELNYTSPIVPIDGRTVRELRCHIEQLHGGSWWSRMNAAQVTEFSTYGLFARHLARHRPKPQDRRWVYMAFEWPLERERFEQARRNFAAFMVHSHIDVPVDTLRALLLP